KPELLARRSEHEIRMRLWQVEQLLPTLAESYPERAAAGEREKRLDRLEARSGGVAPRIQEAQKALAAVGGPHEEHIQDRQGGHGDHQQMAQPSAAHEEQAQG